MDTLAETGPYIGESVFFREKECYFQPFYSTEKKCIWGAEALFRLKDENGDFYNMDDLVAKAEEEGWVMEIDRWMFREVCRRIPEIRNYGLRRININLSPEVCQNPDAVESIQKVLNQYQVSRSEICLEITEMCKVKDDAHFTKLTEQLTELGIRLALDDFGKGESNLLRMMQIPFSTLKMDKEMIWKMNNSRLAVPLVEEMIHFAHRYGIQVTAEGVETLEQARELASFGCDYLQGYFISPPLSYADFLEFLKNERNRDFLKG